MKGSEPEWASQKQITSQVIPTVVGHTLLQVYMFCAGAPGYTSCEGYIYKCWTYPVAGLVRLGTYSVKGIYLGTHPVKGIHVYTYKC